MVYQALPQCSALVLAALLAAPASPARAQEPGEAVEGVLTNVELVDTPRTITVEKPRGGKVVARIANRTLVLFRNDQGDVGDLKPGMTVRFKAQHGVVDRIHVVSGSGFDRAPVPAPAGGEVKARILEIDPGRGRLTVDVAGRRESYTVRDTRMLRGVGTRDLVVLSLGGSRGDEVTEIRSAAVSGRVTRLDRGRVEIDGRDLYDVDDSRMLDDVREGDMIRFEFEDRSGGRKVITRVMSY